MAHGYLQTFVLDEGTLRGLAGARVILIDPGSDSILYDVVTNADGNVPVMMLDAPDTALSLDPNFRGQPYSIYNMQVTASGFHSVNIQGIEIFADQTALQPVTLHRASPEEIARGEVIEHVIITGSRRRQMQGENPEAVG